MEGSQRAMRVALAREQEKLEENLPFLASVASVSPYIGLFGTVWGIMVSFLNIANAGQPSLATVAPGIAEALIATAMGLFAAIPAVWPTTSFLHVLKVCWLIIKRLPKSFRRFCIVRFTASNAVLQSLKKQVNSYVWIWSTH